MLKQTAILKYDREILSTIKFSVPGPRDTLLFRIVVIFGQDNNESWQIQELLNAVALWSI